MKMLLSFLSLLILMSCARTIQYTSLPSQTHENKARIYVIRTKIIASALNFRVFQGKHLIGELGPKSYLAWDIEPTGDEITIVSESENTSTLTFKPEKGKTYYIKQRMKAGILSARTGLEFLDKDVALKALNGMKAPLTNGVRK